MRRNRKRLVGRCLVWAGVLLTLASATAWAASSRRVLLVSYVRPADPAGRGAVSVRFGVVDGRQTLQWESRPYAASLYARAGLTGWRVINELDTRRGRWAYDKPDYDRVGPPKQFFWGRFGAAVNRYPGYFRLRVPSAYVTSALALAAGVGLLRGAQMRRRRRRGLCLACGYDLRASPGRCPECGADAPMPGPSGTLASFTLIKPPGAAPS